MLPSPTVATVPRLTGATAGGGISTPGTGLPHDFESLVLTALLDARHHNVVDRQHDIIFVVSAQATDGDSSVDDLFARSLHEEIHAEVLCDLVRLLCHIVIVQPRSPCVL